MKKTLALITCLSFVVVAVFSSLLFVFAVADSNGNEITVNPSEIDYAIKNPSMGWLSYNFQPFTNPSETDLSKYSTKVYSNYFTWKDLEPQKGIYQIDLIENYIKYWADRGIEVAIGIHCMDTTSIEGDVLVPEWVKQEAGGVLWDKDDINNPYKNLMIEKYKWEPDYSSPVFKNGFKNLLQAIKNKYDSSEIWKKYLKSIDISTYGNLGEWHSKYDAWFNNNDYNKRNDTLLELVKQFDVFKIGNKNPQLTMNIFKEDLENKPNFEQAGITYAVNDLKANMMKRCIGAPLWLSQDEKNYIEANWKTNRFIGEFGSVDGSLKDSSFRGLGENGSDYSFKQAVDMALNMHASELGWYSSNEQLSDINQMYPGTNETYEEYVQKRLGYRLVMSEAKYPSSIPSGNSFTLNQVWQQKGVATLYDKYNLKAYLSNGTDDIELGLDNAWDGRGWIKGSNYTVNSSFTVPTTTDKGWYDIKIAIVDETGNPALNLAIANKDTDEDKFGKYKIGRVYIGEEKINYDVNDETPPQIVSSTLVNSLSANGNFSNGDWFSYLTGAAITPKNDITVKELGKYVSGDSVKGKTFITLLVDENKNILARKDISIPTNATNGTFVYNPLDNDIKLLKNKTYYILGGADFNSQGSSVFRSDYATPTNNEDFTMTASTGQFNYDASTRALTDIKSLATDTVNGANRISGIFNFKYDKEIVSTPQSNLVPLYNGLLNSGTLLNGDWFAYLVGTRITPTKNVTIKELGKYVSDSSVMGKTFIALVVDENSNILGRKDIVVPPNAQANSFVYAPLDAPIDLESGKSYYLLGCPNLTSQGSGIVRTVYAKNETNADFAMIATTAQFNYDSSHNITTIKNISVDTTNGVERVSGLYNLKYEETSAGAGANKDLNAYYNLSVRQTQVATITNNSFVLNKNVNATYIGVNTGGLTGDISLNITGADINTSVVLKTDNCFSNNNYRYAKIPTTLLRLGVNYTVSGNQGTEFDIRYFENPPPPQKPLVITNDTVAFVNSAEVGVKVNNVTKWVGTKFKTSIASATVTHLGRYFTPNSDDVDTRIIKLIKASDNTVIATAGVRMGYSYTQAENGFKYAQLSKSVQLEPNTEYYLLSNEISGTNPFYVNNTVAVNQYFTTLNGVTSDDLISYINEGTINANIGPVSFKLMDIKISPANKQFFDFEDFNEQIVMSTVSNNGYGADVDINLNTDLKNSYVGKSIKISAKDTAGKYFSNVRFDLKAIPNKNNDIGWNENDGFVFWLKTGGQPMTAASLNVTTAYVNDSYYQLIEGSKMYARRLDTGATEYSAINCVEFTGAVLQPNAEYFVKVPFNQLYKAFYDSSTKKTTHSAKSFQEEVDLSSTTYTGNMRLQFGSTYANGQNCNYYIDELGLYKGLNDPGVDPPPPVNLPIMNFSNEKLTIIDSFEKLTNNTISKKAELGDWSGVNNKWTNKGTLSITNSVNSFYDGVNGLSAVVPANVTDSYNRSLNLKYLVGTENKDWTNTKGLFFYVSNPTSKDVGLSLVNFQLKQGSSTQYEKVGLKTGKFFYQIPLNNLNGDITANKIPEPISQNLPSMLNIPSNYSGFIAIPYDSIESDTGNKFSDHLSAINEINFIISSKSFNQNEIAQLNFDRLGLYGSTKQGAENIFSKVTGTTQDENFGSKNFSTEKIKLIEAFESYSNISIKDKFKIGNWTSAGIWADNGNLSVNNQAGNFYDGTASLSISAPYTGKNDWDSYLYVRSNLSGSGSNWSNTKGLMLYAKNTTQNEVGLGFQSYSTINGKQVKYTLKSGGLYYPISKDKVNEDAFAKKIPVSAQNSYSFIKLPPNFDGFIAIPFDSIAGSDGSGINSILASVNDLTFSISTKDFLIGDNAQIYLDRVGLYGSTQSGAVGMFKDDIEYPRIAKLRISTPNVLVAPKSGLSNIQILYEALDKDGLATLSPVIFKLEKTDGGELIDSYISISQKYGVLSIKPVEKETTFFVRVTDVKDAKTSNRAKLTIVPSNYSITKKTIDNFKGYENTNDLTKIYIQDTTENWTDPSEITFEEYLGKKMLTVTMSGKKNQNINKTIIANGNGCFYRRFTSLEADFSKYAGFEITVHNPNPEPNYINSFIMDTHSNQFSIDYNRSGTVETFDKNGKVTIANVVSGKIILPPNFNGTVRIPFSLYSKKGYTTTEEPVDLASLSQLCIMYNTGIRSGLKMYYEDISAYYYLAPGDIPEDYKIEKVEWSMSDVVEIPKSGTKEVKLLPNLKNSSGNLVNDDVKIKYEITNNIKGVSINGDALSVPSSLKVASTVFINIEYSYGAYPNYKSEPIQMKMFITTGESDVTDLKYVNNTVSRNNNIVIIILATGISILLISALAIYLLFFKKKKSKALLGGMNDE